MFRFSRCYFKNVLHNIFKHSFSGPHHYNILVTGQLISIFLKWYYSSMFIKLNWMNDTDLKEITAHRELNISNVTAITLTAI